MLNILVFVLEILSLIILVGTSVLLLMWAIGNLRSKVPFITAPSSVFENIDKALGLDNNSVVYDLGCGDGRILFYLSKIYPKAKYIGIENRSFPVLLARLGSFLNKKKTGNKIEVINDDFFNKDLKNATHIFTYLYPNMMDDLLPKFDRELKPGTKLVSLSFQFSGKKPINEVDLGRNKYKLGRKLYIYQF